MKKKVYICKYQDNETLQQYLFKKFKNYEWRGEIGRSIINLEDYNAGLKILDNDNIEIWIDYEDRLSFTVDGLCEHPEVDVIDFKQTLRKMKMKKLIKE